ncbi:haloacid dehalogenase-like hydrolase [Aspergillus coremiiformis]|uniref:Haloacid dehalogenase-like hydrolase n=1 Tax=Aspergillus coremiiformis TaxID=138285 RepID=A0A5N6ZGU1_9EURO|nr:haloacid dehalogenase-like hydrolase [Aspergillus coremiiformis]
MTRNPRILLLTLDAFETIFHPHPSVPEQYASAAHTFGLSTSAITAERLQTAFKPIYKAQCKARPNYGRNEVILGRYGGPKQWWEEIIRNSFSQAIAEHNASNHSASDPIDLPEGLVGHLLERFSSKEGYTLYEDVGPFFSRMRAVKTKGWGPFDRVLVGVVSNSDDRVPAVLKSLGLRVGEWRADEGVESMRLPGFEERSSLRDGDSSKNDDVNDVDLVITSYEAGVEKPSPRIFEVAKRQARALVGPSGDWTCVHIGDDLEKDYQAAVGAGWDGFFLDRGNDVRTLDGVKVIRSLTDLIPVLEAYT